MPKGLNRSCNRFAKSHIRLSELFAKIISWITSKVPDWQRGALNFFGFVITQARDIFIGTVFSLEYQHELHFSDKADKIHHTLQSKASSPAVFPAET